MRKIANEGCKTILGREETSVIMHLCKRKGKKSVIEKN